MLKAEDKDEPKKRTLSLAKTNYSEVEDIELYNRDGLLVPMRSALSGDVENQARDAVRDVMLRLLAAGIQVVRGNGAGLKPRDVAAEVREKTGIKLTARKVGDYLAQLEIQGILRYVGANKNMRDSRAGFVKGPNADGPVG